MSITVKETGSDIVVETPEEELRRFDKVETPRDEAWLKAEAYADGVRRGMLLARKPLR